jgi:glycosyltransferase 2 family protein
MIGVVVFALILLRIDLRQAWRVLASVDAWFLALSLALQGVALIVTTFRWQIIMRHLGIRIPFWRSFIYQVIGTAAGQVTPGEFGEFLKVLYHRRDGFPVPESALSVLVDRLYDLAVLLIFGLLSLTILFDIPTIWTIALYLGAVLLVTGGYVFAAHRQEGARWMASALARITPVVHREAVRGNAQHLAERVGTFPPRLLLGVGLVSVANYALLLIRVYALALAVHIEVSFTYFVQLVPLLRLVGLVPISISGIGTRDVAAIYLLGRVGVPQEASLVLSMLSLVTLQVQALVGLLVWWRHPLHPPEGETRHRARLARAAARREQAASQGER